MKWTKHEAQEASQLLTVLSSTFNRELDEAGLTGYLMGMEDIPVSAIRTAVSRAIREQRFMPTVAELRRLAGEMDPEARAITAWACVRDQIGKVGAYRSITFTDGAINAAAGGLESDEDVADGASTKDGANSGGDGDTNVRVRQSLRLLADPKKSPQFNDAQRAAFADVLAWARADRGAKLAAKIAANPEKADALREADAPGAVYGWNHCRVGIINRVVAGTADEDYQIGYNFVQAETA